MKMMQFERKADYERVIGRGPVATSFNPPEELLRADNIKARLNEIPDVIPLTGIYTGVKGDAGPVASSPNHGREK